MAEVALDIKVNAGNSTNALKEARQEIKNLTAAALEAERAGDKALSDVYAKKAAEAKDQVKDLQEKINALDPGAKAQAFAAFGQTVAGGLTAAISATALFGEKNEQLEATLLKVQSATALLQSVQAIADGVKQASLIKTVALTTAQGAYATVVGTTTGALKLFRIALATTGIGLVVTALGALIANFEKVKQAISSFLDTLKNIPLIGKFIGAVQDGASKVLNWVTSSDAATESQKELNTEIDKSTESVKKYNTEVKNVAGSTADYEERISKLSEKLKQLPIDSKEYINTLNQIIKLQDELILKQSQARGDVEIPGLPTKTAKLPDVNTLPPVLTAQAVANQTQIITDKLNKSLQESNKVTVDDYIKGIETSKFALEGLSNLSEVFYASKLAGVKKGSKEEERILRQQFNTQKKMQIAMALINGAQAVTAILSVPDFTLGVASAIRIASAVAATAATVAKIASTKFEGGGGGGSVPSGGGGGSIPAPTAPTVPTFNPQGTIIPQSGQQQQNTIKAYVLEDDISTSQNRITDIKTKALYG